MSQTVSNILLETAASVEAAPARTVWYLGNWMKVHVSSTDTHGQFALVEAVMQPGSEPPMHIHEREDETFVVLEGRVEVICGGVSHVLKSGDSLFAPRLVPHTFRILTPVARVFNVITPGGFEDFFRVLGHPADGIVAPEALPRPSFERVGQVAAQFGVRLVG